jgi:solute carrier family 8 (sodium/calcium exchanger)
VNDGEDVEKATAFELTSHYITVFWKLFAACIPPATYLGGWATFWTALLAIMVVTALIMDLASIFGCLIGLEDAITAITFVALGTSVPDTFASMMSARQDDNADNSIGNITGSNSVNVFLGLGLPWLFAAIYWEVTPPTEKWLEFYHPVSGIKPISQALWEETGALNKSKFIVQGGSLGFNTLVFSVLALGAISLLMYRRKFCGGELGGDKKVALFHSVLFFGFWVIYIIVSSLRVKYPNDVGF